MAVRARRVYDPPDPADGRRVLVDRVWPRGLRRQDAHLDEWARDVAPTDELRRWYGHDPQRFPEFRDRYVGELADPAHQQAVTHLRELAGQGHLTLLTATRDLQHSQAAVLADWLTAEHP